MSQREKFIRDLNSQLDFALSKFPNNEHNLVALMEEVGELSQAMLQQKYEPQKNKTSEDVYLEAVQVATMAMKIALYGDTTFPDYNKG